MVRSRWPLRCPAFDKEKIRWVAGQLSKRCRSVRVHDIRRNRSLAENSALRRSRTHTHCPSLLCADGLISAAHQPKLWRMLGMPSAPCSTCMLDSNGHFELSRFSRSGRTVKGRQSLAFKRAHASPERAHLGDDRSTGKEAPSVPKVPCSVSKSVCMQSQFRRHSSFSADR